MKIKKLLSLTLVGALSLGILSGCSGSGKKADDKSDKLKKVTIVLDYAPNTKHTGI